MGTFDKICRGSLIGEVRNQGYDLTYEPSVARRGTHVSTRSYKLETTQLEVGKHPREVEPSQTFRTSNWFKHDVGIRSTRPPPCLGRNDPISHTNDGSQSARGPRSQSARVHDIIDRAQSCDPGGLRSPGPLQRNLTHNIVTRNEWKAPSGETSISLYDPSPAPRRILAFSPTVGKRDESTDSNNPTFRNSVDWMSFSPRDMEKLPTRKTLVKEPTVKHEFLREKGSIIAHEPLCEEKPMYMNSGNQKHVLGGKKPFPGKRAECRIFLNLREPVLSRVAEARKRAEKRHEFEIPEQPIVQPSSSSNKPPSSSNLEHVVPKLFRFNPAERPKNLSSTETASLNSPRRVNSRKQVPGKNIGMTTLFSARDGYGSPPPPVLGNATKVRAHSAGGVIPGLKNETACRSSQVRRLDVPWTQTQSHQVGAQLRLNLEESLQENQNNGADKTKQKVTYGTSTSNGISPVTKRHQSGLIPVPSSRMSKSAEQNACAQVARFESDNYNISNNVLSETKPASSYVEMLSKRHYGSRAQDHRFRKDLSGQKNPRNYWNTAIGNMRKKVHSTQ